MHTAKRPDLIQLALERAGPTRAERIGSTQPMLLVRAEAGAWGVFRSSGPFPEALQSMMASTEAA